ncbi:MAG: LuxR C-terminal-related transcriptional regulator [Bacillota bacterium]|nr:LuxR C-terminal-related transcriptional regulator [Bacillota bacterium]
MLIVVTMLIWNYFSYFWGETSVYWGNSEFIRAPLDLTIIFWLIITVFTLIYVYRRVFLETFTESVEAENKNDIEERISEVCAQFKLTPREKELVEQIYAGKSNREIADMLFLSESTIKTHIYNIFKKMDVKSRVGVICVINGDIEDGQAE